FMEGLNIPIGRFLITDPEFWPVDGVNLVPTESFMRRNNIGNGALALGITSGTTDYGGRLRILREFLRDTGCLWPSLARKIHDCNCAGDGVIGSVIEQEPNPSSRVSLTDEVDSFGLRRIQMNWQLTDGDLKTIRVLSIECAKEMARFNRARVQLAPFILDANVELRVSGYGHHMGTTRMSADPRYGVVDENCRVHGIQNLYLAGSSVFPRCGGRKPTLTIVLLSLRLGEFLSKAT